MSSITYRNLTNANYLNSPKCIRHHIVYKGNALNRLYIVRLASFYSLHIESFL